ncbi:serine/threonine-protein kinase [Tenggerimyces flavus]|uniref:non-specific serine/threonine protein kinase n=1 Tax=Tenggerimyces flavus TaxID=1708749 RepID=A0ABV7YLT6_9ACTN|nr:serine/threonine-protein kinase [Tenggerimyces flavus]MBM7788774.1 serine/threonine protein kinase [Tenggerimyces flavus]
MQGDFVVEGYEIEGLLGAGPAGEVWLARDKASHRQVALKRLRPRDDEARDRARRLVSTLDLLSHPNLLGVQQMLPYGDEIVFVLEHANGGSLGQLLLVRGTLDPGEVVTVVGGAAQALAAAHARGLVHGDLTPENILFSADGRPQVTDLGLLALVDGGEALGTHGYTDPSGLPTSGPTAEGDVYALAAVCLTALTGTPPDPNQKRAPLHQVAPGVPSGLAHAVEAGLHPEPAARPNASQFAELLATAAAAAPVRFPEGLTSLPGSGGSSAPPTQQQPDDDPFISSLIPPPATFQPTPPSNVQPPAQTPPTSTFPVGPPPQQQGDDEDEPPQRRTALILLAVGLPLLVLAIAITAFVFWPRGADPKPDPTASSSLSASPTTNPTSTSTGTGTGDASARWTGILNGLDKRREEAYAKGDPALLTRAYAANSPGLAKDQKTIRTELKDKGYNSAEGLQTPVSSVKIISEDDQRVVLDVTSQLQAYTLVTTDGRRLSAPGGDPRRFTITLVPDGQGGWLIFDSVQAG